MDLGPLQLDHRIRNIGEENVVRHSFFEYTRNITRLSIDSDTFVGNRVW